MIFCLYFKKRIITLVSCSLFCFVAMNTYSADVESDRAVSYGSCVVEKFKYFVDWVEKELKDIDDEYFSAKPNNKEDKREVEPSIERVLKSEEKLSKPLNLSIPEIEHLGTMPLDEGQKINFPDMFSGQVIPHVIKEEPGASFGGRLLMDDAEIESMQEYRLNDVKDAIRGAELSLEFKTN